MARKIIPDIVHNQTLFRVSSEESVLQAVKLMSDHQIGAVLVMEGNELKAIFTERDLALRVVAKGLDCQKTAVGEVATMHPDTLNPRSTPRQALKLMRDGHYRHLPVMDEGRVVGIVSVRDLYGTIIRTLEEDIIAIAHHIIKG